MQALRKWVFFYVCEFGLWNYILIVGVMPLDIYETDYFTYEARIVKKVAIFTSMLYSTGYFENEGHLTAYLTTLSSI